jgi:phage shock protein C
MKKTVDIQLGGLLFHLDEDAFVRLSEYLDQLRRHLAATEGREEVLSDIEARIAELFRERLGAGREVVALADVEEAMRRLGAPSEFGEAAPAVETGGESSERKRLYRDGEDRLIAGVCAGLGHYFAVDPVVVRIAFVLFGFVTGVGVVAYLVLWAAMPRAVTAAERLAMRGRPATFENIRRAVEEEVSGLEGRLRPPARRAVERVGEVVKALVRGTLRVVGVLLLLVAFAMGAGLLAVVWGVGVPGWGPDSVSAAEFFGLFMPDGWGMGYFVTAAVLVLMAPLVAAVLLVVRVGTRAQIRGYGTILAVASALSIAGVALLVAFGIRTGLEFSDASEVLHAVELPAGPTAWTWRMVDGAAGAGERVRFAEGESGESSWVFTPDRVYFDGIELDVEATERATPRLEWTATAEGGSRRAARARASSIAFGVQADSTGTIQVSDVLSFPRAERFRGQRVRLVLYLPVGQTLHIDPTAEPYLDDVANLDDAWDGAMGGRTWQMTSAGLTELR